MYKKVMIIDDTEVDRYVAERVIQKSGFSEEIISMESVQEALDYLMANAENRDRLPEIIFLDIRMPVLDGFDFLDKFNNLPDSIKKRIIIVMLTSSLNQDDHSRATNSPYVHQFINKPLNKEELNLISIPGMQDQ
jgi:CheY-like chemotaxis protein